MDECYGFANIDLIRKMYVYEYTFLDDLRYIIAPNDFFNVNQHYGLSENKLAEILGVVKDKFLSAGWEGDGSIV